MDKKEDDASTKGSSLSSVVLTEKDIDGASLAGRHPTKLTKQELKFWLDCRAVKHKKLKTKAELVTRVLEISKTDVCVVDPTSDLIYTKRKLTPADTHSSVCDDTENDTLPVPHITQPASDWKRIIPPGITFNDVHINDYVLNSGKRALKLNTDQPRKKTCIRPETKGYRFFTEKYLHDIWCTSDEDNLYFKSKCFPSQRKNDEAHKIWCALDKQNSYNVALGQCTCVAGKSGYCNHLMALLYQISHFSKSSTVLIPDDLSKTSMPMTWQKPRIEGIAAEPIMQVAVRPTSVNREFPCTLYEARTVAAMHTDADLLTSVQNAMAADNPKFGICMARKQTSDTTICRTQIGTWVPLGSPLSYQLALTEGDYHVDCNTVSIDTFKCKQSCIVRDMTCYPALPMCPTTPPQINAELVTGTSVGRSVLEKLAVDAKKSHAIEMETRDQAKSDRWWEERKLRITASKFGDIMRRKQSSCKKFVERLQAGSGLNGKKMPMALKHGRDYENVATRKYKKYMTNIGHKVEICQSGLVVREDYPHLGASPDGKVLDPVAHPHFGILEVKCPYKYRSVKPRDAAMIDNDFCLSISKFGLLKLKKTNKYYNQVQGQMLITGAKWCDFIVYTFKGLHIERVAFDEAFCDDMLQKLNNFYFTVYLTHAKV